MLGKQCGCRKGLYMMHMHMHGGGGPRMFRVFPFILLMPLSIAISSVICVILTMRLTKAVETMAMTKALDEMEGRLSDAERTELESKVRANLFGG